MQSSLANPAGLCENEGKLGKHSTFKIKVFQFLSERPKGAKDEVN